VPYNCREYVQSVSRRRRAQFGEEPFAARATLLGQFHVSVFVSRLQDITVLAYSTSVIQCDDGARRRDLSVPVSTTD
jgi:hypothetical protein